MPQTIMFVLPHMRAGGIEFVVRELVNRLDRQRWVPILCLASAKGDLLDSVSQDVEIIDNGGIRAVAMMLQLPRLLKRHRVDVVYVGTNAMNVATLAAFRLIPRARRPKLIVTEHTSAAPYLAQAKHPRLRKMLIRHLYPTANLLGSPLKMLAREWVELTGIKGLAIAELPNPVIAEAQVLEVRARNLLRVKHRIVAAGRLVPDKGHDVLIDAMALLHARAPDATLDIFGTGPEQQNLESRIARHGLSDVVRLRGYTSDLLAEFAQADIVVVPSRREGFGNVVLEALAMGARIVASDCPGPRVILRDGALGELVQVGDSHALTKVMATLLDNPQESPTAEAMEPFLRPYYKDNAVAEFQRIAGGLV